MANSPFIFGANGATSLVPGGVTLPGSTSGTIRIQPNATTTSYALTMPNTQGGASTTLSNDGSGNLSWVSAGGGGSSSYVNIIEQLEQKSENEHYSIFTDSLDNSISSGFNSYPSTYFNQGILLQSTTGTASSIVYSPVVLNQAAKDTTTTTNWSIIANAATLTTSATTKVGAASVSFTKNATGLASIKYDYGSVNFAIPNNTRLWFWINLANTTNLTNVQVTLSTDASTYGTNFQTFTTTTDYSGSALTTGWNLCFFDLSTGGSATGTGWNSTLAARFFTVGINTTSSASTVILVNGIYFSYYQPTQYVPLGSELTVFDGTHTEIFQIDSSNSRVDGPITLTNTLSNTYAGGFVGASVYRSTVTIGNNQGAIGPNDPNGNVLAGAITTSQSVRLSRILRSALSSNTLTASATVNTSQVYSVSSTTTNVIVVNDSVNQIANLLSGDTVHVFSSNYADGTNDFIYLGDFVLTSNATNTTNLTTLTGTGGVPAGTAAGSYVVKKNLTASYSAVSTTSNESFNALSPVASPDGIVLMSNGIPYPYPQNVWSHWTLGNPQASKNIYGPGANLITVGSLTSSNPFKFGQLSTSGWSGSNYFNDGQAVSGLDGVTNSKFTVMGWFNLTTTGTQQFIVNKGNNATTGWTFYKNSSDKPTLDINAGNAVTGAASLSVNTWYHFAIVYSAGVTNGTLLYINGVLVGSATQTISATSASLHIGANDAASSALTAGSLVADVITWSGVNLTLTQIQQIYNAGIGTVVGQGPLLKYRYQATGVSGQRLTYKLALATDTTAVLPFISEAGIIKTS